VEPDHKEHHFPQGSARLVPLADPQSLAPPPGRVATAQRRLGQGAGIASQSSLTACNADLPIPARRRRESALQPATDTTELVVLGTSWCAFLILFEATAAAHYDGIRHSLMILPGLALLIAAGTQEICRFAQRFDNKTGTHPGRSVAIALVIVGLGHVLNLGTVAWLHPYQDAYLNLPTRVLVPDPPENYIELEYWGAAYKEGSEWLNANAEPEAQVFVVGDHIARHYLNHPVLALDQGNFLDPGPPPKYLMYITRVAYLGAQFDYVENNLKPVYAITRGRATLLKIYKNIPNATGDETLCKCQSLYAQPVRSGGFVSNLSRNKQ